jgi:hypothetical protein
MMTRRIGELDPDAPSMNEARNALEGGKSPDVEKDEAQPYDLSKVSEGLAYLDEDVYEG